MFRAIFVRGHVTQVLDFTAYYAICGFFDVWTKLLRSKTFLCSWAQNERFSDFVQGGQFFLAGGHGVDPRSIDVGVTQEIGQADYIFFPLIVVDCKEMAQIVGKYFADKDACFLRCGFHHMQDVAPVKRVSCPGDKDASGPDFLFPAPCTEHFAQGEREEDFAGLVFERDDDAAGAERFHCYIRKLSDSNACCGDRLHDVDQLFVSFFLCGCQKSAELVIGQVPLCRAEG